MLLSPEGLRTWLMLRLLSGISFLAAWQTATPFYNVQFLGFYEELSNQTPGKINHHLSTVFTLTVHSRESGHQLVTCLFLGLSFLLGDVLFKVQNNQELVLFILWNSVAGRL